MITQLLGNSQNLKNPKNQKISDFGIFPLCFGRLFFGFRWSDGVQLLPQKQIIGASTPAPPISMLSGRAEGGSSSVTQGDRQSLNIEIGGAGGVLGQASATANARPGDEDIHHGARA